MYNPYGTKAQVLLRVQDRDEERRVMFSEDGDGGLTVTERSDGRMTFAAFGSLSHGCRVSVAPAYVTVAMAAIGATGMCAREALGVFFHDEEVFLSDFQDLLDAGGVPYACTVWNGDEVAFRTTEGRWQGLAVEVYEKDPADSGS